MDIVRLTNLITSVIFLIASVFLVLKSTSSSRWIYMVFSVAWVANISFYVWIIFFNTYQHDMSSILRLFTNCCFGIWLVILSCEKLCANINIKARIKTWNLK